MNKLTLFSGTTPKIDKSAVLEIEAFDDIHLGGGVVCFRNAFDPKRELMSNWIDKNAQSAHEQRWTYHKDSAGNTYATNEDGNKFTLAQIEEVPVRVLQPVTESTEEDVVKIFQDWENQIYKCLIKYAHRFPFVLNTIWWRSRGHVLRYDKGDYLGVHNDNDSNYRATGGVRYVPRGQVQMRQVVAVLAYINDCVADESELDGTNYMGGELFFPYLDISHQAKSGDILIFPTNYMASHGVSPVLNGQRYAYLEFFSQGNSDESVLINVAEPGDCDNWCRPHWVDSFYDDACVYAMHADFGNPDTDDSLNPIYQGRSLEGEKGLPIPIDSIFVPKKGRDYPKELL